jgi:hypothetical protein
VDVSAEGLGGELGAALAVVRLPFGLGLRARQARGLLRGLLRPSGHRVVRPAGDFHIGDKLPPGLGSDRPSPEPLVGTRTGRQQLKADWGPFDGGQPVGNIYVWQRVGHNNDLLASSEARHMALCQRKTLDIATKKPRLALL